MTELNDLVKKKRQGISWASSSPLANVKIFVDHPRLFTNNFPQDFCFGGGIPFNLPVQLFGPFEGGKTTSAILIAKALSRICHTCLKPKILCKCKTFKKAKTFYLSTEGLPPDGAWMANLGYDIHDNMLLGEPDYGEQACEMIEEILCAQDCGLIIVDSMAGMTPKAELEGEYEDYHIGLYSRLIGRLMKRLQLRLVDEYRKGHLIAVIFINQVRSVIGMGGGSKGPPQEGTPGGWASKHAFRLSARVGQIAIDPKDKDAENLKGYMRLSLSLLSKEAKQQVFSMAGKEQCEICVQPHRGWLPGSSIDFKKVLLKAKEYDLLRKTVKDEIFIKGFHDYPQLTFRNETEIEKWFKTDTDEAAAIRYIVLNHIKEERIAAIKKQADARFKVVENPNASV